MGKVEIKIRKKILTPDNLERYRNYPALLKKYERNKRFKRAVRIFLYSLALTMLVLTLIFISMWKVLSDKRQENKSSSVYTYSRINLTGRIDTLTRTNIQTVITDTAHTISFYRNKLDTTRISLPINSNYNSGSVFWLDEKIFTTKTGDYLVIKYLYDDKNIYDEELLHFYSPEYGIILEKSVAWGIRIKLTQTGNPKKDQKINQLTAAIEADSVFFNDIKIINQAQ